MHLKNKKRFRGIINETGIDILTYDKVISWYENDQRYKKLVLKLTGDRFEIKYMPLNHSQLLAHMGTDRLVLTNEQFVTLQEDGYDIEKWRNGELLTYNFK